MNLDIYVFSYLKSQLYKDTIRKKLVSKVLFLAF